MISQYLSILILIGSIFPLFNTGSVSLKANLISSAKAGYIRKRNQRLNGEVNGNLERNPGIAKESLNDYIGNVLVAQVSIGTPPQPFSVAVNILWPELWVVDSTTEVENKHLCGPLSTQQSYYDIDASSSAISTPGRIFNTSDTFSEIDLYAFASGPVVKESVQIDSIKFTNLEVGRAVYFDELFLCDPIVGVLGLGWPSRSKTNVKGPFFADPSVFDQQIFSIYIDPGRSFSNFQVPSQLTLGGLDTTNCKQGWIQTKCTSTDFWQFSVDRIHINNKSTKGDKRQAVIGTVSAGLVAPKLEAALIAREIGAKYDDANEWYYMRCGGSSKLPNINLDLGVMNLTITPDRYLTQIKVDSINCLVSLERGPSGSGPISDIDWQIGIGLIRDYCVSFDAQNKLIGFATSIPSNK